MLRQVGIVVLLALLLMAGAALWALAADPGSKDDPLVTQSYVRGLANFKRVELPAKRSLRVSPGCEFVLVDPVDAALPCPGLDPRKSIVVNLSAGQRVSQAQLDPYAHYVNGGSGDAFLKFNSAAVLLLKGEWK